MGMVSGMPLDELRGRFGSGDLVNIATQLGTVMARFHGSYFSGKSQIGQAYGAWNTLYENRRHQFIENLGQTVSFPSCLKSELRAFVCSTEVDTYLNTPHVLVHGDLTCYHIYVEEQAGHWRVSGIIDMGNALAAPPEYDWTDLWFQTLERDVQALIAFLTSYQSALKIDENYRRRLMAFFLHSWEAAPKLATLLGSENAPDIKDIGALLDWLWPRELETS